MIEENEEKVTTVAADDAADGGIAQELIDRTAKSVSEVFVHVTGNLSSLGIDTLCRLLVERPDLLVACRYCIEWDPLLCGGCIHIVDEAQLDTLLNIARAKRPMSADDVLPTVIERLDKIAAWCQKVRDARALCGD